MNPVPFERTTTKLVGTSIRPREAEPLLKGEGRYLNDVVVPRMLHLAFVRSPHAHARIRGISTELARRVPGVVAVLTGRDLEGKTLPFQSDENRFSPGRTIQPLLATDKVRYAGEAICAVIADSRATAEDARDLIEVDFEPLPPVVDPLAAVEPGAALLHEDSGTNILIEREYVRGEVPAAFEQATVTAKRRFRIHRKTALPMEGRGCVAAYGEEQWKLTVWISHQLPFIIRHLMAEHLGLKENDLRVIAPDTGGGYGLKAGVYTEEFVVAFAALTLKRPVKWVEDRIEHLGGSSHSRDQLIELEMAANDEGRILGIRAEIVVDVGAYSIGLWSAGMEPLQSGGLLPGPYRVPAYQYHTRGVATNKMSTGPYRAVGRPSASASLELLLDEVARKLGKDPTELRRINLIREEDEPFRNINNLVHSQVAYRECFEQVLQLADYEQLRAEQRASGTADRLRGIGVVCYAELTGLGTRTPVGPGTKLRPGRDAVMLRLEPSGVISISAGMPSQGQRIASALSQVAADELGVRFEDTRAIINDTAASPYGFGTFASRTAVIGSGAVMAAARNLKARMLGCAAHLLEASVDDLEIVDSIIWTNDRARWLTLADLARISYFEAQKLPSEINPGFEVVEYYDPDFGSFAGAAHLAVVDVDRQTGQVQVIRYVAVEDCGRMINPEVVLGQIQGGIASGLGEALMEELVYDETGQLTSGTLMDFLVPTTPDVPNLEIHHVVRPGTAAGGFKGVGEGSQTGAVASICCAVVDALKQADSDLTEFPAAPDRVWNALAGSAENEPTRVPATTAS